MVIRDMLLGNNIYPYSDRGGGGGGGDCARSDFERL